MAFRKRGQFEWPLRTRRLALGAQTLVMGVLNVTPDSFSDGGLFLDTARAVDQGLRMLEAGAAMVDVGGESTRPGSHRTVSAQEEQDRVLPVMEAILKARPEAVISIDTYKAATAAACLRAGAEIVNDVSGFLWDEAMPALCAAEACGVVLMHTRGTPNEWRGLPKLKQDEVVPLVRDGLRERLAAAVQAGVAPERVTLDPGYGFGKVLGENYSLLAGQDALLELGRPLLVGVSRKSFLRKTLERELAHLLREPDDDLTTATMAACTAAVLGGAHIVRVHDVAPAVAAVAIADEVLRAG
uniref:Dihydropteroate synthase n=1 Tax=Acidobacterium capsulatum TaxID=33075 RepID=A0A7V4XTC2_9BACT